MYGVIQIPKDLREIGVERENLYLKIIPANRDSRLGGETRENIGGRGSQEIGEGEGLKGKRKKE
jgi:hypothetical protein